MRKIKLLTIILLFLFALLTLINPPFPHDMYLQHLGTLLLISILIIDIINNYLRLGSFMGIAIFTALHILAARWVYSFVPYNDWIKALLGFDFNQYFGFHRNHFDRFVHFLYGILIWPFLMQVLEKWKGLTLHQRVFVVWLIIQTTSMFYELFEWVITLVLSSEAADNYNGQQGDWWDAQKDMALTFVSSSFILLFYFIRKKGNISGHK